jgi:hypothetical protein
MSLANRTQIGGIHYKQGEGVEEHWDRAWRMKYDCFQYIITKWVERWRDKGGLEDLKKARHAIDKYIEVVEAEQAVTPAHNTQFTDPIYDPAMEGQAGRNYVGQ